MLPKYNDTYILELETSQVKIIKTLFETIKDILLTKMTIIFTPNYIKLDEQEEHGQCAIHLELDTTVTDSTCPFEQYYCEKEFLPVGLDATNFFKIIKTVDVKQNDMLSFYIRRDTPHIFTVKIENDKIGKLFSSDIKILDNLSNGSILKFPNIEYPEPIVLTSHMLQKVCKDMKSLSSNNAIEITIIDQQIVFCYKGEFSKQTISLGRNVDNNTNNIIRGVYSLEFLLLLIKATNLSHTVIIYMNDNCPLILEYSVGNLGTLKFLLCDFQPAFQDEHYTEN